MLERVFVLPNNVVQFIVWYREDVYLLDNEKNLKSVFRDFN